MAATEQIGRLGDIAGRIDAGHGRLHRVIDQNALGDMHWRAFEKSDVGRHASGDDQQIAIELLAGGQRHGERAGLAFFNPVDAGFGHHLYALLFHPALDHAACLRRHHARHHAVAHFDDAQFDAAFDQRFHDDAADKAGAELQHTRAGLGQFGNRARIRQRPAGLHFRQIDAGNRRPYRMRTGGDQQAIEVFKMAIIEQNAALFGVDRDNPPAPLLNAQLVEMIGRLAQIGAGFVDITFQQIGNRHP